MNSPPASSTPLPPTPPPVFTTTTTTATPPPPIRGRPRSSSISNGSDLPLLSSSTSTASAASTASPWTHHRPSLSVPGIAAPFPLLGATSGGRMNRHRRTQSVSPPGFPTISELAANGFTSSLHPSTPPPLPATIGMLPFQPIVPVVSPAAPPPPRPALPSPIAIPHARIPAPRPASSSPSSASPSSSSPHPHHSHGHHSHFPSSHAALLQGVRSHALPSSPTLEPSDPAPASIGHAHHPLFGKPAATLSTSPPSPPFGPTPITSTSPRAPSPLALELADAILPPPLSSAASGGTAGEGEDATGEAIDDHEAFTLFASEDGQLPGAFNDQPTSVPSLVPYPPTQAGGPPSPPLFPLPLPSPPQPGPSTTPPEGRPRSSSFGTEHVSPVSLFLEQTSPPVASVGICDLRTNPEETLRISPPPSPTLFHVSSILPPPSSSSSPPPPLSTSDDDPSLIPPPSPHRSSLPLPPPLVAPAPIPPHLGGPPLAHHQHHRSKKAAAAAARAGLSVEGAFIPKRHSPLASFSAGNEEEDEGEGMDDDVEEDDEIEERGGEVVGSDGRDVESIRKALGEAESTDMDLSSVAEAGEGGEGERGAREGSVSPPPSPGTGDEGMGRRNAFGALGFMDVDDFNSMADVANKKDESEEVVVAIDEESLSALEKIFVCAKSENPQERARVAHNLANWLEMVDIAEAVEYVLPLLAGLATDSEELVKEVFAPQLDEIMWHFFTQCPLLELAECSSEPPTSPAGSPVPSRYTPLPSPSRPSPTSTNFASDIDSTSSIAAPTTSKTSPSNTEVSDAPRISVTTFTSLLGALLTDQSTLVANSTQATLVRFLCRLRGKPIPSHLEGSPKTSPSIRDSISASGEVEHGTQNEKEGLQSNGYQFSEDARRILEDEFINGIVLGLARLDDDEREGDPEEGMESSPGSRGLPEGSSLNGDGHLLSNSLVLSPDEDLIEDSWLTTSPGDFGGATGTTTESWGEPLVSYFNDANDRPKNEYTRLIPETSSPAEHVYSSFSPDGHADEESAIGKLVSMSLIGAIAATDCFEPELLYHQLLPEVERMKSETTFYVRKEAVQALASLARSLPAEVFELSVLPLHAAFAKDALWHVRRAACLALPTICKRLPPALLRSYAVSNIKLFSEDPSRNVRSGALEVCGELIYLFYGDPDGVPDELLAFFLDQPMAASAETTTSSVDHAFAPLQTALDSPPQRFFDPVPWSSASTRLFAVSRDPDRPVMCAFNLPAVALTMGRDKWHLLRAFYLALCTEKSDKVRQSLASSMHEIAKILGPQQADSDLVEPFSHLIRDYDFIQGALLENISSLLLSFSIEASRRVLESLSEAWSAIKVWRRRETLARDLAKLTSHFVSEGAAEEVLSAIAKAFKDPVAAVREQAVYALPAALSNTGTDMLARSKLWAFLAVFSEDSSYRNRVTYTSCALASVRSGIGRETFETFFVDSLGRLARDRIVNVRIGVAKVIAEACRSPSLYTDPDARAPIAEMLYYLAHSADRDVVATVAEFCCPTPRSTPSPPPEGLDRAGARSRMDMYEDEAAHEDNVALPVAKRSHLNLHGIDDDMADVPLDVPVRPPPPPPDSMEEDAPTGQGDIEMLDEGVLLEPDSTEPTPAPASPQMVVTRELEGEDEFLEVSRR